MSDSREIHPGEQRLQRYADGELLEAEALTVRRHVDSCARCGARIAEIGRASDAYRGWVEELKSADPPPPRPWLDLRPSFESAPRPARWRGWAAAAGVAIVAIGGYYRMTRPAPVNAAELLRKAAAVERAANPARRIRVRTAKREVVRPAVLEAGAASGEIETLFAAARFNWQDPLSVRSFAAWREHLPDKQDKVRQGPKQYEIQTTTSSGSLHAATLVLDARDLHAVSETLEFASERVEISEAEPALEPAPAAAPSRVTPPSRPSAPPQPGPADELRVIAALHEIAADLGEPIQVTRSDESLLVVSTGLTTAREREVQQAVSAIPGVVFRARPVEDASADASPGPKTPAAAPSRLLGVLGEEGVNRILDASEAVMARVYALRSLSRRFPQAVEAQLADADRDVLAAIRGEHVSGIRHHLAVLQSAVGPLLSSAPEAAAVAPGPWQPRAERLLTAAQSVDQILNRVLAGGQDFAPLAPELRTALRRLQAEIAAEGRP